jgi:PDZ domain-containing protein
VSRGGTWLRRAFLPVTVAILVLAGAVVPLPAYIELPGAAAGIPACVRIAERPRAQVDGDFLFTTVGQRNATVFGLLIAGVRDDQAVVSRRQLLGDEQRDAYLARQRQVFLDATDRALLVAMAAAGLPAEVRGSGVDVLAVLDDAPARGVLRAGDVITAIDDRPVDTTDDLIAEIDDDTPVMLAVQRDGGTVTRRITPQLREVEGETRPVIGIQIATHAPEVALPLAVDVSSGQVGGPSAGLMIGLAVFDLIDDTDLAAGRRVAGTGTLAVDGTVGQIDGIRFKVAAAERAGADVFLAPAGQADAARAAVPAGSDLAVLDVETFEEARAALARTGGATASGPGESRECRFAADA